MMQLKNSRRQLGRFFHRGEDVGRRASSGTQNRHQPLYLLGGTLLGFGLGYLAAYYLRRPHEESADSMGAELTDWGSTDNPLHGDHGI
ncbi:hypothetical protein LLG95_17585 [bacterium]|nr:hypothetical protein [bacterium]